mmetsp:Transcript_37/g.28  ORF Transcript_37/g.28 Transcript_37/m.28 type:complete len:116 (-) Transcript_37:27-374(-)
MNFGKTLKKTRFKTPQLKMNVVRPILPAPGLNLQIPTDLTVEKFCKQIGGDCEDVVEHFTTVDEIFNTSSEVMRIKGVPCQQRKHLLMVKEKLRRGLLTFEYLGRRTCLEKVKGR